jgi:hypothetical protein
VPHAALDGLERAVVVALDQLVQGLAAAVVARCGMSADLGVHGDLLVPAGSAAALPANDRLDQVGPERERRGKQRQGEKTAGLLDHRMSSGWPAAAGSGRGAFHARGICARPIDQASELF